MDKLLRPERFETDQNSPTAAIECPDAFYSCVRITQNTNILVPEQNFSAVLQSQTVLVKTIWKPTTIM